MTRSISTPEEAWAAIRDEFGHRRSFITAETIAAVQDTIEELEPKATPAIRLKYLVQIEVRYAEALAAKYVETCCEIWEALGHRQCRPFWEAVFRFCLVPLFEDRRLAVDQRANRREYFIAGRIEIDTALAHFSDQLGALQAKRRHELEFEARNSDLGEKRRISGHRRRLPEAFIESAGTLFEAAKNDANPVRSEKLLEIAIQLDAAGYKPPKNYLEKNAREQLTLFNSKHANSKSGPPIETWTDLVKRGEKDVVIGMRRLLYRCASLLR